MVKVKRTIAVFSPDKTYLSHCTWDRAIALLKSRRAIRLDATTIQLKQTRRERMKCKHEIIADSNRICYICNEQIPEKENATIDHIVPKSRDKGADTYTNMKCCCGRCNRDKGNKTLSEYAEYISNNREQYPYISDKRLIYLKEFAKSYEEEFFSFSGIHSNDVKFYMENLNTKGEKL